MTVLIMSNSSIGYSCPTDQRMSVEVACVLSFYMHPGGVQQGSIFHRCARGSSALLRCSPPPLVSGQTDGFKRETYRGLNFIELFYINAYGGKRI